MPEYIHNKLFLEFCFQEQDQESEACLERRAEDKDDAQVYMDIRVDLDTENNADSRSLYSAVERGDITGMSFMFVVDKDSWEDLESDHPTRHIRSISKVFEVSACTFPAYEATSIQTRGLSEALDSARESLESAKAEVRRIEAQKQRIRILSEV